MSERYLKSVVRTNKLYCTNCEDKIKKGDEVVFLLDDTQRKPMQAVYCSDCSKMFEYHVIADEQHPFDMDE